MFAQQGIILGRTRNGPQYDQLSGVVFHNRTEGLVLGATNDFGVVDGSGNVTTIESCDPFANGRLFNNQGTAPTLVNDYVTIPSTGNFRDTGVTSVWNDFHYKADASTIQWTIHGVFKFDNAAAAIGIFGNNGTSSTAKGIGAYVDDRTSIPNNKYLNASITRGVAQSFVGLMQAYNIIPFGEWFDFWLQVQKSSAQAEEVHLRINRNKVIMWNRQDSNTAVITPTYAMEFGAVGNATIRGGFSYKEITFQTGIHTDAFAEEFIAARMEKYGIAFSPDAYESFTSLGEPTIIESINDGKYHLTTHLCQKPSNGDIILSITDEGEGHLSLTNRRIVIRTSTNRGATFSSKVVLHSDATNFPIDPSAGYDSNDRLWLLWPSATTIGGANKLWYAYSDDDGATLSTPVEITSILPADGLTIFRTYSTVIENAGRIMIAMYKQNSGGASSATYLLYSDNNGVTWGYKTIRAASATYRNECDIVHLSGNNLLIIQRNESTNEWDQYISTDNGDTWTAQGDITFGESITAPPAPVRLRKTQINGTDVIACAYTDRDRDVTKVAWAKVSSIIASGISGWNYASKCVVWQGTGYGGTEGHMHYFGLCYPNNNFEGLSMSPVDPYPTSGGTSNVLRTMRFPTYHYPFIKSLLGL
jgi:hypothetical protein